MIHPGENPSSLKGSCEGLSALVLAAGASSRMQRRKPLLRLGGSTLLARAVGTFTGADVRPVVVVVGSGAESLVPRVLELGVRCEFNPSWEEGMYSSIRTGIGALGREVKACFVLPVDMPAVRSRTVWELARSMRRTGAEIAYPVFEGERGHPPLFSASLFEEIRSGDGRGGLCALLDRHERGAISVPVLDQGVVVDLDTPGDYAAARTAFADRSVPTPKESRAILARLGAPAEVEAHGRCVARLAVILAISLVRAGHPLDVRLLEAAAQLHDLAKGEPDHARAGALCLSRLGFARLARVVAAHTNLPAESRMRLDEAALLYLADKLVRGDRIVGLPERFDSSAAHCLSASARSALERRRRDAEAVAEKVSEMLGADWYPRLAKQAVAGLPDGMVHAGAR